VSILKLLIAEDDPKLLKSLIHILENNKFSVDGVNNGDDALNYGLTGEYDGIILDIMMPGMDGLKVLQALRAKNITTPALFLTARTEVSDRVEGLDAGADDYLPKPFSTVELLARIRAMLRRKDTYLPDLLTVGSVTLNRSTYQLSYGNEIQSLSGKEFQILEMLMQQPGMIIPSERFITHLWGWDTSVDTSVIWVHISNLRKKISAVNAPAEIRFIRNAGYVLEVKNDRQP
jgi:two-component system, OmpR family, response regulator ArlR